MNSFFSPTSIAIVGASANPEKTGYAVLHNIIEGGFSGEIYPINPHETEIMGKSVYKKLNDTPTQAELVVIVIPSPYVPAVIQDAADQGIKTFVIITAGFGEIGEAGAPLDEALKKIIKEHNVHIMGPNCLGVIAPHSKLNAAFGGPLPKAGNVALLSQSGAIISSLCDWAGLRHFGFSKVVSLGNTLQLNENDCLEYLANDNDTEVIVLFLKHFHNKEQFLSLAAQISKRKSIILYKAGGEKAITLELRKELAVAGILLATSLEGLYNTTHLCSVVPLPKGKTTTVITNAGGPGVIATDAVHDSPLLEFAQFSESVQQELIAALPAEALPVNPIDLIGDAKADLYEAALNIILKNKATDSLMVMLSPQAMTQAKESAEAIVAAKQKYPEIPIVTCFLGGTSVQTGVDILLQNGIPCYLDPARAIKAIETLKQIGKSQER
jgi:acetyltransferase